MPHGPPLDDKKWDTMYSKLKDFHEENSHCRVPQQLDRKLYVWVKNQKSAYKKGKLLARRKLMLDMLGVFEKQPRILPHLNENKWALNENKWDTMYSKLKDFHKENNHCRVPQQLDRKLHIWVKNQKIAFKKGVLLARRKSMLDVLGVFEKPPRIQSLPIPPSPVVEEITPYNTPVTRDLPSPVPIISSALPTIPPFVPQCSPYIFPASAGGLQAPDSGSGGAKLSQVPYHLLERCIPAWKPDPPDEKEMEFEAIFAGNRERVQQKPDPPKSKKCNYLTGPAARAPTPVWKPDPPDDAGIDQ